MDRERERDLNESTINEQPTEGDMPTDSQSTLEEELVREEVPDNPKPMSPFWRGLLWGTIVSLTVTISGSLGAALVLLTPLSQKVDSLVKKNPVVSEKTVRPTITAIPTPEISQILSRPVNILVMGIDKVKDVPKGSAAVFEGHSDAIALLRLEPKEKSVRLLSIPKDISVDIPNVGKKKLNEVNSQGGTNLTIQTVSQTFSNITIDRYIRLSYPALIELVDRLGGIEVFVPQAMFYRDKSQNLKIDLDEGWQTFNGEQALQFVLYQDNTSGEFGRLQRQQIIISAIARRLRSPAILSHLPEAITLFRQHIDTNLTLTELKALADLSTKLDREQLQMVILPGNFSANGNYEVNLKDRDRLLSDYFAIKTIPNSELNSTKVISNLKIYIQNATDDTALGEKMITYLKKRNFQQVSLTKDSPLKLRETTIVVQKGDLKTAKNFQEVLNLGKIESSSTGELDSDLTLILGEDIKEILPKHNFFPNRGQKKF